MKITVYDLHHFYPSFNSFSKPSCPVRKVLASILGINYLRRKVIIIRHDDSKPNHNRKINECLPRYNGASCFSSDIHVNKKKDILWQSRLVTWRNTGITIPRKLIALSREPRLATQRVPTQKPLKSDTEWHSINFGPGVKNKRKERRKETNKEARRDCGVKRSTACQHGSHICLFISVPSRCQTFRYGWHLAEE